METGIKETMENILVIGLYEPGLERKLSQYYDEPVNGPEMAIYKTFSGRETRFELDLALSYGENKQLKLSGYDIMLPRVYPPIVHDVNNGFSSLELEERMKAIDWSQHPGNFFDRDGNAEWLKMDDLMHDIDRFTGVHQDRMSGRFWELNKISDALMARYLTGTPLATALMMTVPYHRSTFYELYPFPPTVHASVGGNVTQNLKQVSETLMQSYKEKLNILDFSEQLKLAAKGLAPKSEERRPDIGHSFGF